MRGVTMRVKIPVRHASTIDPKVALRIIRPPTREVERLDWRGGSYTVTLPAPGHNRYCGPGVVATLTGLDTAEAAALIRRATAKRSVRGMYREELRRSLILAGFDVGTWYEFAPRGITMREWIRETWRGRDQNRAIVVNVTGHYITVAGGWWIDNVVKEPQPLAEYPKMRQRVRHHLTVAYTEPRRRVRK